MKVNVKVKVIAIAVAVVYLMRDDRRETKDVWMAMGNY